MEREIDFGEVTDGRFYDSNDMVKVGCHDCEGCSACCRGMGESILLDPMDVRQLTENLHTTFDALLQDSKIELRAVDGVILPNLRLSGKGESCPFLTDAGRCSIHAFRPGICRLFPLGRIYENNTFRYFLQVRECPRENRTKMKVRQWIGMPEIKRYEKFISDWHYFVKELQRRAQREAPDGWLRQMNLYVLQNFYRRPFTEGTDFYQQFAVRLEEAGSLL